MAHRGSALEQDWFVAWTFGVGEGAQSLGGFVVVGQQKVVQAVMAEFLEEPLATLKPLWLLYDRMTVHELLHTCKGREALSGR